MTLAAFCTDTELLHREVYQDLEEQILSWDSPSGTGGEMTHSLHRWQKYAGGAVKQSDIY